MGHTSQRWVALPVVGAVAFTLLAAGCSSSHRSASSGPTTTSTTIGASATTLTTSVPAGRTVSASTTSRVSTTVRGSHTQFVSFSPWTSSGTVAPGVQVSNHIAGTACTMATSFDPGNQYAWRCSQADGGFYDPCFAPPGHDNVTTVACGDSPWSKFAIMTLAQPLAHSSWGTPTPDPSQPWAMLLAGGQQCGLIEGTGSEIGGVEFNYGCNRGYAAYPNAKAEPWVAPYAATTSGPVSSATVTTAWM